MVEDCVLEVLWRLQECLSFRWSFPEIDSLVIDTTSVFTSECMYYNLYIDVSTVINQIQNNNK